MIDGISDRQLVAKRNWATAVHTYRSALTTYRRILEMSAARGPGQVPLAVDPPPRRGEHALPPTPELGADALTPREREVVELLARGYSNQHIAKALVLTRGTVANHVAHILAKLGAANRTQVAAWLFDRTAVVGDASAVDDDRRHRLVG